MSNHDQWELDLFHSKTLFEAVLLNVLVLNLFPDDLLPGVYLIGMTDAELEAALEMLSE